MEGYKIKKLLKRLDWTQVRLAKFMGVSQPMISAWCNNIEKISKYRMEQLQYIAIDHYIKICFIQE